MLFPYTVYKIRRWWICASYLSVRCDRRFWKSRLFDMWILDTNAYTRRYGFLIIRPWLCREKIDDWSTRGRIVNVVRGVIVFSRAAAAHKDRAVYTLTRDVPVVRARVQRELKISKRAQRRQIAARARERVKTYGSAEVKDEGGRGGQITLGNPRPARGNSAAGGGSKAFVKSYLKVKGHWYTRGAWSRATLSEGET